jgi:hypothetical protein
MISKGSADLKEVKEKLSSIPLGERKEVFSSYASGKSPDEWKAYFKAMREAENELKRKYSHLPDNRAVSLARGVIWELFIE